MTSHHQVTFGDPENLVREESQFPTGSIVEGLRWAYAGNVRHSRRCDRRSRPSPRFRPSSEPPRLDRLKGPPYVSDNQVYFTTIWPVIFGWIVQ